MRNKTIKESFTVKLTAILLLMIFPSTQIAWSAESIQMANGQPQAVTDPFAVSAKASSNSVPADFLQNTGPLSAPTLAVASLPPARITLSSAVGLTSANVMTLPGSPRPYIVSGSTFETRLQSPTANVVQMNYKSATASAFSGVNLSFDNASTTVIETQNLSALTYLTFGIKGDSTIVRLQIEDVNGAKDEIDLNGVSATTEKFWRIPTASLSASLDKTKIKSIRFVVSAGNGLVNSTGTLFVRANGLNMNAPTVPVVTSTVPAFTNQSTVTLSGTKEANTAILINGVEVISRNSATTWTAQVALSAEGANAFSITTKNMLGKVSAAKAVSMTRDTVIPTGTININSSASYATSRTVTLNLSAADNKSGMGTMSFSEDGMNWTAQQAYARSKNFTLSDGDGSKKIFVKYFDKAGNASAIYSKSITLDLLPPVSVFTVNNGMTAINQTAVVLNLAATDAGAGLSKMSFSSNGTTWTTAENYAATKNWNFTAGDGNKTVYVKVQDKTGKWSAPVSVKVALDTVKPTGSLSIGSGSIYSRSQNVTLNLSAVDTGSGLAKMSFSTDNVNWSSLEAYATSKTFLLPTGDGSKTVYVKYFDKAGNESLAYSKSIILDTTPPDASTLLFDGKSLTNKPKGSVALSAGDAGSGLDQVRFTLDQGATWSAWSVFSETELVEFSLGDGEKEIRYEVRDRAGNISFASDSITLDQTPPVLKLLTSVPVVRAAIYVVEYLADGISKNKTYQLTAGTNALSISETDDAGNATTLNWNVEYEREWDVTLPNGTLQHFEEGILKYEISLERPVEVDGAALAQVELFAVPPPESEAAQGNALPNVDVYAGDNLQAAIDSAQFGQTVLLHAGSYLGHFVLKDGVSLIGENRNTVILHGNFETNKDVVAAMGNNRIENLTITGGGRYYWGPSSAINVQGNHVQILNNSVSGNKDYGIYISENVSDVLIEKNLIKGNNVGVQLPKDGNQIRLNTLVQNSIAVNILNGTAPVVEKNIISDNTYQSIYEFGWGLLPTNGRAIVRDNTLFNNPEKGGAYGLNLPPAMETRDGSNWSQGNILANPQFVNPVAGDYSIKFGTPAFARGAYVPAAWSKAIARAAQFNLNSTIQEIKTNGLTTGYQILYPAGTVETFMNDGTETLDTVGPVIEILSVNPILVRQPSYDLNFMLDGSSQSKRFNLQEGLNVFSIQAADELGNQTLKELSVTLDTVMPVGSLTINQHADITNYRDITLALEGMDATSGVEHIRFSFDGGSHWTDWENFTTEKNLNLTGDNGAKTVQYQIEDKAGNLSVVYSKSITLNIPIQVTSAASTTSADYVLHYLKNGMAYEENWHLSPGSNYLVIEDATATPPVFVSFRVDYLAEATQPLTELLTEDDSLFFNLDLTPMRSASGELLSDLVGESSAQMSHAQFDEQGQLKDAILKFKSGRVLQLIQGKVRQILDASGTLQQYASAGELEAVILSDGSRTSFAERLDDFTSRNLLASAASSGGDVTFYNLAGQLRYGLRSGARTIYENGILKQVTTSNHFVYGYAITGVQGGGYESHLQGANSDASIKPTLLRYDSNRSLTYIESSDGSQFEFESGVLTQARNSSGEQTQYSSNESLLGEILNFDVTRAGVQRTYDERGQLSQIVTSSGLKAQVSNNRVSRIDLGNGQYATDLTFDADGSIVESKVHNADSSIAHYVGGVLIETELSDHSVVTYTNGKARLLKTADGRIYQYVYVQDGSGQETAQVLRADLVSYASSSGNKINLSSGELSDFVLNAGNSLDHIASGSQGSASPTFIPLLSTPENIIRNLRLDTNGKMISAEILNKSGDQYFVANGYVEKIITSAGKTLTFHDDGVIPANPVTPPLTSDESLFRNQLIEQNLQYFKSGQGIDPVSGLPFDNLQEDGSPTQITQPTAIGFYLQILGAVLDGSYSSDSMSKQDALDAAQKALSSLLTMQSQVGWRGLVPFANLGASFSRYGDSIGLGDNANLTQSLAILIGSIEKSKANSGLNVSGLSALITQAETFIGNQSAGYSSFYDSSSGLLRSSYDIATEVFSGSNDRLMNEFRTGIAFVITRFGLPQAAWDNLVTVIRTYQDKNFNDVLNAVPFDGGAFQMFWPLLRADQELSPSMKTAAWNFLYSLADYASKNSLPGFPSASFDSITQDYQGKIGVPDLAETRDSLNTRTISVYSLASAYALAPQFVLAWLKAIQEKYPDFVGALGFYDSITMPESGTIGAPVVGKRYYAIDQASFLLGLLNNAGADFNTYLDTREYRAAFDGLYDKLQLNITPVQGSLAVSPFTGGTLSSIQAPQIPSSGFHLSAISGSQNGQVDFDYLFSPKGELNNVDVTYHHGGIERSTDLLTYFERTQNLDEKKYLLNSPPINLFDTSVERGAVFTQGQGSSVESRVQDPDRGFVKAFDYQIVPNGQPVGYYSKFNNLDLSDVDFITFSVRRDTGSQGPESLEVKLEGLGETFIVDNIPTGWARVVLPLKKPNTDLSRIAILIHDQVSQAQSGRIYLGDISLFSVKDYSASSWESATGLTSAGIEVLAEDFLTGGANPNAPLKSTMTQLVLNADGKIDSAQVASKDGSLIYIQGGQVSKIVTSDGKTIIYKNGEAETVTGASGETASFNYDRDYKNQIQQIKLSEPGIQRIYDKDGHLDRLVFDGLSGDINQGILSSLRTRSESITDLVSDGLNHIKDARISLSDGRILVIKNYKLSETILLSGTNVIYDDDGYVTLIHSETGDSQYIYQKDVNGNITSVSVKVLKQGQMVTKDVVAFLREDNRIEEAAILLESALINVRDIAPQLGAFFTPGRGQVSQTAVVDADRNNVLKLDYSIPADPSYMGIYFRVPNLDISKYKLMSVALKGSGNTDQPSVTLELKGPTNDRLTIDGISSNWSDTTIPIDSTNAGVYEITMLINPDKINTTGTLYLDDISFFNVRKMNVANWEQQLSFNAADLEQFSSSITQDPIVNPLLYSVPVPGFQELRDFVGLPKSLTFDATGKVTQLTRGDGTQINVSGDLPISAQMSNGQAVSYQINSSNQITSATVTDSSTAQTFNTTQYGYDKVRQTTLSNGQNLEYYYEFDAQGREVTVIYDPQTKETKKFVNGLIQSADNGQGLVTTYSFNSSGSLKESHLSFQGKANLDVTQYEKHGDKTYITDTSGTTWIYDAAGYLVQHHTADGLLYQHTTDTDEHGEIQNLIFLIQSTASDGTIIYYDKAEISRIVFKNGTTFINPKYDSEHNLSGAKVIYEDGSETDYVNQYAVKSTNIFGDVTTYVLPQGKIAYELDTAGKVEFVRIDAENGLSLRYNREGDLVNLLTLDGTLYQYIYEEQSGVRTGRMKVYRRQLAQLAGSPIPFPVSADADSYGNMHVMINGQTVFTAQNKVQVVAINPSSGAIDTTLALDMANPNEGTNFLNFIKDVPDGEYVMVIYPQTSNGYSVSAADFMNGMKLIGGDPSKPYFASQPWIVMGQKGLKVGQLFDGTSTAEFNGGTIRLDTESRDVFYLNAAHQLISESEYGLPSNLLGTALHGANMSEMTEVFGTISNGSTQYAAAYFKNYNIKYPESGLYRFLANIETANLTGFTTAQLDAMYSGIIKITESFKDKAIYYDERYPSSGIKINDLRVLKAYLISKGFQVLTADKLKDWISEKGSDSIVLMAQDIAPDTIVNLTSTGSQPARDYLNHGGSLMWLYDIPFYQIGHADNTKDVWGSAGDNYGLRTVLGISVAYEPELSKPVTFYQSTPCRGMTGFLGLLSGCYQTGGSGATATYSFRNVGSANSWSATNAGSLDSLALSQTLHLGFDINELDAWQTIKANFEKNVPSAETDIASVFDSNGVILGVRKGDGSQNVFEEGKLRSILDRTGNHLIDYFYNLAGELTSTQYLQARRDLDAQIHQSELPVAQLKTKALLQIASNRAIGVQSIQNELNAAYASLASSRSQVESQRYITQCHKCGCSECCEQRQNPGYSDAMNNINAAQRQVEEDAALALSNVDIEVGNAYTQINQDQVAAILKIQEKKAEILRSVVQNEIAPVMMQYYRLLLGRDPSTVEMNRWLDTAMAEPQNRINTEVLKTELSALPERAQRLAEIALIKSDLRTFLDQYVAAGTDVRVSQAASLGLLANELVSLDSAQVSKVMSFLDGQNLHFGYSAFLPLQALLAQNNLNISARDIAVKSLLIDILTGTIHPYSEGNLEISIFALERTAKVLGAAPNAVKMTYDELKQIYAANPSLKAVVHIKGNHYVTLMSVTSDKVTYIESAMGSEQVSGTTTQGEVVEVSREQFEALWLNPLVNAAGSSDKMGVVLMPEQVQVQPERVIDRAVSKLIKGADCGISALIAIVIVAAVSGAVQAFTASSGNFFTNFIKGFAFSAIVGVVTLGIGTVLSGFASAVARVATNVVTSIKSFVSPIMSSLQTFGSAVGNFIGSIFPTSVGNFFSGTVNLIGRGIGAIQSFGSSVMKVATQGFKSLQNFVQTGSVLQRVVANSVMGLAVNYGTTKGLTILGVNPEIAMLVGAFATGAFLGAVNAGGTVTGVRSDGTSISVSSAFDSGNTVMSGLVLGGVESLQFQAIPVVSQSFGLSSNVANILQSVSKVLSGGNVTGDTIKGLSKTLTGELSFSGLNALGGKIGLSSGLSQFAGLSFNALAGTLTGSTSGNIFSKFTNSLISTGVSGAISYGVNLGVRELGLNNSVGNILLNTLSGFAQSAGIGGSASGALGWAGNLLSGIASTAAKFGSAIVNGVQNVISLGADILQRGYESVKNTFTGLFSRETQEVLYGASNAGGIGAGAGWVLTNKTENFDANNNLTSVVEVFRNSKGDETSVVTGVQTGNFTVQRAMANGDFYQEVYEGVGRGVDGGFGFGSVSLIQRQSNGFNVIQQLDSNGRLKNINIGQDGLPLLQINSKNGELQFKDNGEILNGSLELYAPMDIDVTDDLNPQAPPTKLGLPVKLTFSFLNGILESNMGVEVVKTVENYFSNDPSPDVSQELYVLVNGILNDQTSGAPKYLENMKDYVADLSENSSDAISKDDVLLAPTFFTFDLLKKVLKVNDAKGYLEMIFDSVFNATKTTFSSVLKDSILGALVSVGEALVNGGKDVTNWIKEVADPSSFGKLAFDIQTSIKQYYERFGEVHRSRDIVAVGYSGGFMPLAEVLSHAEYKPTALVGLGAATIDLKSATRDLLVKIMLGLEMIVQNTVEPSKVRDYLMRALVTDGTPLGFGVNAIDAIINFIGAPTPPSAQAKYEFYLEKVEVFNAILDKNNTTTYTNSNLDMVVNVYGSRDLLANLKIHQQAIGGYRDSMWEFQSDLVANPLAKPLVNIEIKGATHFDYMRREPDFLKDPSGIVGGALDYLYKLWPGAQSWNERVAEFTAQVAMHSDDHDELEEFLKVHPNVKKEDDVWVVKLPGWDRV